MHIINSKIPANKKQDEQSLSFVCPWAGLTPSVRLMQRTTGADDYIKGGGL